MSKSYEELAREMIDMANKYDLYEGFYSLPPDPEDQCPLTKRRGYTTSGMKAFYGASDPNDKNLPAGSGSGQSSQQDAIYGYYHPEHSDKESGAVWIGCRHEPIDVGFTHSKWVCKKCNADVAEPVTEGKQ